MSEIEKKTAELLKKNEKQIHELWKTLLIAKAKNLVEMIGLDRMKENTLEVLGQFSALLSSGTDIQMDDYRQMRKILGDLSKDLTLKNMSPSETATFIFSLKDAIVPVFQKEHKDDRLLMDYILVINRVIDQLGLYTFEVYLESRESLIREQQQAFMEVSVPVVKIWDRILMIPLVGMLDSTRTQLMMETMLTSLEDNQANVAILDISGIPVVDTLVARHLVTAASAAKLMGAECIITGIRAKISQTLVQLGVDLSGFSTCSTLADGLRMALASTEQRIG
ncbi:STAS domain-containing protein [Desulfobacter latus]|uniref:STAS domain-containing protein n=1 Tax=Desulfobacter latus TaxID=2292 RepID=A0A850T9G2_9BACT|nr:STAS domain-containing protein [Desulfobacter latus]NWH05158.1 STAS domain-containing protein [Desulfobacter latus]